jgi:hypothetical protein
MASHAGGIPGFRAYVMRIPGDRLYIALLSNDETADTQPEYVAKRIAASPSVSPCRNRKSSRSIRPSSSRMWVIL